MRCVVLAVASLLALAAVACARGTCSVPGASPNADGCAVCERDLVPLLGACVSPRIADAYCGAGARFVAGRCVARGCAEGAIVDVASGECVPSRAAIATAGADVSCPSATAPAIDGGRLVCLGDDALCPRGSTPRAGRCAPAPICRPGEIALAEHACASLFVAPRLVDVGAWIRAVVGAHGGPGTRDVCAPIALRSADLPPRVRVAVALRFPANQVADARATVVASDAATGAPLAGEAQARVEASFTPIAFALRALGGESSAAAVDVVVTCATSAAPPSLGVKPKHP